MKYNKDERSAVRALKTVRLAVVQNHVGNQYKVGNAKRCYVNVTDTAHQAYEDIMSKRVGAAGPPPRKFACVRRRVR